MREKLKKMMWGEPTGEWIPYTFAEYAIMQNICENLPEITIAEPVTFAGENNGRRNTEKQASLYDAMLAEIYAEHDGEKARVRNRRNERRNHMAENWEAEKERRKDLHWNHLEKKSRRDAGSKYGNHWASNAERKICKAEQVARKDWELESDAEFDAEIEEKRFREAVEKADKYRAEVIRHGEYMIKWAEKCIRRLSDMELPTDRDSLRKFMDDVEWEDYGMRSNW